MDNETIKRDAGEPNGPQFREAFEFLVKLVVDGVRHGHFQCRISSVIGKGGRRELLVEAGKSHKFNIPEEELPH